MANRWCYRKLNNKFCSSSSTLLFLIKWAENNLLEGHQIFATLWENLRIFCVKWVVLKGRIRTSCWAYTLFPRPSKTCPKVHGIYSSISYCQLVIFHFHNQLYHLNAKQWCFNPLDQWFNARVFPGRIAVYYSFNIIVCYFAPCYCTEDSPEIFRPNFIKFTLAFMFIADEKPYSFLANFFQERHPDVLESGTLHCTQNITQKFFETMTALIYLQLSFIVSRYSPMLLDFLQVDIATRR